jgi:cobaltochelatase CobN
MHVVFRESHGLEETDTPTDPGQDPADLVVLSFSDSDLGAFAAGWHRAAGGLPFAAAGQSGGAEASGFGRYLCRADLAGAKGMLIRLIGGEAIGPMV